MKQTKINPIWIKNEDTRLEKIQGHMIIIALTKGKTNTSECSKSEKLRIWKNTQSSPRKHQQSTEKKEMNNQLTE